MAEITSAPEITGQNLLVDRFVTDDNSLVMISRMRQPVMAGEVPSPELLVGDILRRTCRLGGTACAAEGCKVPEGYDNVDKLCSDMNLGNLIEQIGVKRESLLMVGVTADGVGFYDRMPDYEDKVKTNSVGIRELPGYNAFFARTSERAVLGARLADCGFAAIEFKDAAGEDVIGFVHLTRPNLQGESALKFEVEGRPAGCFEYFMHEAMQHYGADISSVKVRLVAAIKGENLPNTFRDGKGPDDVYPGWFAQGMIINTAHPDWQPGDPIGPDDVWLPQYREMVRWQILRSGIAPEHLDETGMIDPADLELGHASNHAGAHGKMPDGRDAYLVMPRNYRNF